MNFDDYIASRDIRNYGTTLHKLPAIDYTHALSEPPENMEEIRKSFKTEEQSLYEFNELHKLKTYYFISSDDNDGMALTEYRIISLMPFEKNKFKKGVIALSQMGKHRQIIYPFFYHISFKTTFNIFVCSKEVRPFPNPLYDMYYFDLQGRLIHQEKNLGIHRHGLPPVGYLKDNREVLHITPFPKNHHLRKILDIKTYVVQNPANLYGIMSYNGQWIIQPNYSKIAYRKGKSHAFVCERDHYYSVELKTGKIKELPFEYEGYFEFESCIEDAIKFSTGGIKQRKQGIIDYDLKVHCKPNYCSVVFSNSENRNIVFKGRSAATAVSKNKFAFLKNYDFYDELHLGKCGVIDNDGKEIISINQDYIKEIALNHYLVNIGCAIFEGSSFDDDDNGKEISMRFVKGGIWYLYDENGNKEKEISHDLARKWKDEFLWYQDEGFILIN